MRLVMREGRVYRFKPRLLIGHWTVYEQRAQSLFFSGSVDPSHMVGSEFKGSANYPGRTRNRRDWEVLI